MNKEQSLFSAEEFRQLQQQGGKGKKAEENIQMAVCEYLRNSYPGVVWMCDLASGMKMPIWIAARNKKMRSSRGMPDLFIAVQKRVLSVGKHGVSGGLFIELKKDGTVLFNKKGEPYDKHLREQNEVLKKLREAGYVAQFCVGYDQAISTIDTYMGL